MSRRASSAAPAVFEYALLRVVPRVDRGECLNAGVLLYCRTRDVLAAEVELNIVRLTVLDPTADVAGVAAALDGIAADCANATGQLGPRFRWLTAPRSTVVQPGPVHTGLTHDPVAEVARLMDTLVR